MYRADAHFRMGTSHEAEGSCCQDYALADNGRLPFAVVSDGCSTSGRTDIGARVWCLAAAQTLPWAFQFPGSIAGHAWAHRVILGLSGADLDATLGFVKVLDDESVYGFLAGDGVLAASTPHGIETIVVEWAGNMPGYPSYIGDRRAAFIEQSEAIFPRPCKITTVRGGFGIEVREVSAIKGLEGIGTVWPPGTEVAAVMSDGAGQVSGLDLQTVVADLLSFGPAREGAFARRRLNGALKRWAKEGHRAVDDISIAALVRVDV